MTTEEVLEKNKLIAEFMEIQEFAEQDIRPQGDLISWETYYYYCKNEFFVTKWFKTPALSFDYFVQNSKYHTNWQWLIPVVEKIESIHDDFHGYFGVHITSNSCAIQGTKLNTSIENPHYAYFAEWHGTTKIEATYIAVVNWIRWWNQKQKEDV